MNRILLIGNSGLKKGQMDGQTIKVRLYLKKIKDEGFHVSFVDLEGFAKHPFSTLRKIKFEIKKSDRIVLLTAERGSRILIPFINRVNKKFKKPFIFPLIGTSVLHYSIDTLTIKQKNDFILNCEFGNIKPSKKLLNELSKITYILPETEMLTNVFRQFYRLTNIYTLTNFREILDIKTEANDIRPSRLNHLEAIYLSRVIEEKGIIDLLTAIQNVNKNNELVHINIYGENLLDNEQNKLFKKLTNNSWSHYFGPVSFENVIETIRPNDLFIFPTKFVGEGTPGVIVESLLAGVPILSSNFPQATQLLKENYDCILFKMCDTNDLEEKILQIVNDKSLLIKLKEHALISADRYTYNHQRKKFLKYVCGVETIG